MPGKSLQLYEYAMSIAHGGANHRLLISPRERRETLLARVSGQDETVFGTQLLDSDDQV
jgi:hypothetical protein